MNCASNLSSRAFKRTRIVLPSEFNSTITITANDHGFSTADPIVYKAVSSIPISGLTDGTTYFAIRVDANNFIKINKITDICFIKLDVDGHEYSVLKSGTSVLKKRITQELKNFDSKKLYINPIESNKINLLLGPYNSINLMKNDYIQLKNFGFEELDITINE